MTVVGPNGYSSQWRKFDINRLGSMIGGAYSLSSSPENVKDNIAINFVIVVIIYLLHQMSAQYKNINNTTV